MTALKEYFNSPKKEKKHLFDKGTYGAEFLMGLELSEDTHIALLGVPEARNSYLKPFDVEISQIREYFYNLAKIPNINIVDLGDIKQGKTLKDTYVALEYVVSELINKNIIPVILGGTQELTRHIVKSVSKHIKNCELSIIDSRIDIRDEEFHSQSYLNYINEDPNNKTDISIIGYQSYFVTSDLLNRAKVNNCNLYRLGELRNDFLQMEPVFRDSDVVSLDMSAIRQSDNPAISHSEPNGLYAEEVCQLANFAGMSDKIKIFAIFEYNNAFDVRGQSAHLIAQIIWYFIFGFSNRRGDYPKRDVKNYKKIYVKLDRLNFDMVFYENVKNRRFWVEIPIEDGVNKIISCSEKDYIRATNNEIPDRILKNISQFLT
jgi:arginase family enzyme